jgi:hypothetical protein
VAKLAVEADQRADADGNGKTEEYLLKGQTLAAPSIGLRAQVLCDLS